MRRALTSIAVALSLSAGLPSAATAQTTAIMPSGCGYQISPGWLVSFWGYTNFTGSHAGLPYGSRNFMTPGQAIRFGQPASFAAGRHDSVFAAITVNSTQLGWHLSDFEAFVDGNGEPCAPSAPAASDVPIELARGASQTSVGGTPANAFTGEFNAAHIAYRWQRCIGTDCAEARSAGASRADAADDGGASVRAVVTAITAGGPTSVVTSFEGPLGAATPVAPASVGTPAPPARVGWTLVAPDDADLGGFPRPVHTYQWQTCTAPPSPVCSDIAGATHRTHTYTPGAPTHVRVVVTATNVSGTATRTSDLLAVPTSAGAAVDAGPVWTDPADVDGVAAVGRKLTLDRGDWLGYPAPAFFVRWQRCDPTCADVPGATGDEYDVTAADAGKRVRALVRAQNTVGRHDMATAATTAVLPAPAPTAAPAISGEARPGRVLSLDLGAWPGTPALTAQWQVCFGATCSDVPGATGESFTVREADAGGFVRAVVTGDQAGGGVGDALSNALAVDGSPRLTSDPVITGDPIVGGTLRAQPPPAELNPVFEYQWLRCDGAGSGCVPVADATGRAYNPVAGDAGRTLRVRLSAANAFGSMTATSAATSPVRPAEAPRPPAEDPKPPTPLLGSIGLAAKPRPGKRALTVTVHLGAPAQVIAVLERCGRGRGACPKPRRVARATRSAPAGTLALRLPRAKLKPGRHRIVVTATESGRSATRSLVIRVPRR